MPWGASLALHHEQAALRGLVLVGTLAQRSGVREARFVALDSVLLGDALAERVRKAIREHELTDIAIVTVRRLNAACEQTRR
jgi:hypothetical protein